MMHGPNELHPLKADDSNANLVEPKGTALYGGEWRAPHGSEDAVGDDHAGEEVVLLGQVNGQAAEGEEKQSGIDWSGSEIDIDFIRQTPGGFPCVLWLMGTLGYPGYQTLCL